MIKIIKLVLLLCIFFFQIPNLKAQDDLLEDLEASADEVHFDYPAFKAMKIANLQSTKVAAKGDLFMYVSHRFGTVKDGVSTFFGLDNASTKIELVYGLVDGLQLALSRESFRKTYAGSVKFRLAKQKEKMPVNLVFFGTVNINSQLDKDRFPSLKYFDRYSYASQLLISRRINNSFSFEIAPSYVRQNFVWEVGQRHDQYSLGFGGRYKITKRMSINFDYNYHLNRVANSVFNDTFSVDLDIETGGHVFQLLFSNSQSTNEPGFIANASGDWLSGEIFFGFNIVRVF